MASEHPGVGGVTMKVDYGEFTRTPKSFIRAHSWSRLVIPGPKAPCIALGIVCITFIYRTDMSGVREYSDVF